MAHYREAELKNGRVAMAACLGWYITSAGVHPAFNSALSSDPLQAAKELPFVGWLQFILGCGAIEWMAEQIKKRPGYVPGDVFGASYWVDDSDEGWVDYQNKELSNGRLAMVAIMGIIGKLCSWMGILSWSLLSYSYRLFLLTFPVQDIQYGNYGDQIFKH
jgi:light-harvesting complex I chlorophyll a/b binding protein 4